MAKPSVSSGWMLRLLALSLALFAAIGIAFAAAPGTIKVQVLDDGELEIPGVQLTLASATLIGGQQQYATDTEGRATFSELPPGSYSLVALKAGFGKVEKRGIVVASGRTSEVTLTMKYGRDNVEVRANKRPETNEDFEDSKNYLEKTPSGRTYQTALGGAAGVIGSGNASAAGASGDENEYGRGAPMTGDEYKVIPENGFFTVADTPLSTFSIDVDTASYSNTRRYLVEGRLPPRDAVRIEELINYFPYDYAPPTDGAPFATHAEVTAAPWAEGHRLVRLGIKGRELPAGETPARNLVFLVDTSGSMQGPDRLTLVQRGLELLAGQLNARDRVALVVYAGSAGTALEPIPGDQKQKITEAIWALQSGGSTAGGAGIRAAYALAKTHYQKGAVNRVILATDGDFNVGTSSDAELVELIEKERTSGVYLTVLGFGRGNLQDAKMEQLADKGNGNFAYIDDFAELRKVLGEQIGSTLVTIANDVKLQVEWNPAQVSAWRLIGYEDRVLADRDFADDTKDAGEIGAGHTVTALYEVVPATQAVAPEVPPLRYQGKREPAAAAASGEMFTVKLRYKDPGADISKLLSVAVTDPGLPFAKASVDTRWAASVAAYGMLLRDSPNKGSLTWAWLKDTAREARGTDPGRYRAEMLTLVEEAERLRGKAAPAR